MALRGLSQAGDRGCGARGEDSTGGGVAHQALVLLLQLEAALLCRPQGHVLEHGGDSRVRLRPGPQGAPCPCPEHRGSHRIPLLPHQPRYRTWLPGSSLWDHTPLPFFPPGQGRATLQSLGKAFLGILLGCWKLGAGGIGSRNGHRTPESLAFPFLPVTLFWP